MARLALWQRQLNLRFRSRPARGWQECLQKSRFITATSPLVITPEDFGDAPTLDLELIRQIVEQQFHQPDQGNTVRPTGSSVQPFGAAHKGVKRGLDLDVLTG